MAISKHCSQIHCPEKKIPRFVPTRHMFSLHSGQRCFRTTLLGSFLPILNAAVLDAAPGRASRRAPAPIFAPGAKRTFFTDFTGLKLKALLPGLFFESLTIVREIELRWSDKEI
jgi:hypothetical protein